MVNDLNEPEKEHQQTKEINSNERGYEGLNYEERLPVTGKTRKGSRRLISNVRL